MTGPLEIRNQLSQLLDAVGDSGDLHAEMERAKREFFGAVDRLVVDGATPREAGAMRFAEWFLCERPSDLLGDVPVAVAPDHFGETVECDLIQESFVGVFLVQSSEGQRAAVRDVVDNRAIDLCGVPDALGVGDVLIGRLFQSRDDASTFVPSAAMTIVGASPHVAIAFQRDVKQLGLDRRLTQVELEHLMFRGAAAEAEADPGPPLEHIEAEIERCFVTSGKSDVYTATGVGDALRSAERPGAIIEPILEEMAFDTDADLDELRQLLLALAAHVRSAKPEDAVEPTASDAISVRPATESPDFQPRADESLGAQLARRISEGLDANEQIDALFADVEQMFGESIDDEAGDEGVSELDDGDLDPLVREFVWETGTSDADRERLESFLQVQRTAPVPRASVESLDENDVARFVLQVWLAEPPPRRVAETRAAFEAVERFLRWNEEAQQIPCSGILELTRTSLIERLDSLADVARSLAGDGGGAAAPRAFTVVDSDAVSLVLRGDDSGEEFVVRTEVADDLLPDDVVIGELDAGRGSFVGIAVVVPCGLGHLLG